MKHELPQLNYSYDALEPYLDAETMRFHHDEHHRGYVEKLNKALEKYPTLQDKSTEDLLSNLPAIPKEIRTAVRNNGGGHFNHSMLWKILNPNPQKSPSDELTVEIDSEFGGIEQLKNRITKLALSLFGSGYVWLCLDGGQNLRIKCMQNQNCPLSTGLRPLFLMDVWEHAYYLKHQNRRQEYVSAFWQVTDWAEVSKNWQEALSSGSRQWREAG